MSSLWKDPRVTPNNVFKATTWNSNWGYGAFTCIHTLNDREGPWWNVNLGTDVVVTKVSILNRNDCCGDRLNGAKVFVGNTLLGTVSGAK
jgi:hypothetical protein